MGIFYYWGCDMGLLHTKLWARSDIWILKWSAFLFGLAAGGYFSEIIRPNVWLIVFVAVILAFRPGIRDICKDK